MKKKEDINLTLNVSNNFSTNAFSSINEFKGSNNKSTYIIIFTNLEGEKIYLEIPYLQSDLIVHYLDNKIIFHTPLGEKKLTFSHIVSQVNEPKLLVFDYMKQSDFLYVAQTEYNRSVIETKETDYGYYVIVECTNKNEDIKYLTLSIRDSVDNLIHYSIFEVDSSIYNQEELINILHKIKVYKI